jgi:hypothetical protein
VRNCPTTDQSKSKEVGFQYIERIPRHQSKGGDFSFLNAGLAERLPGQASLAVALSNSGQRRCACRLGFFPQISSLVARPVAGSFQTANFFWLRSCSIARFNLPGIAAPGRDWLIVYGDIKNSLPVLTIAIGDDAGMPRAAPIGKPYLSPFFTVSSPVHRRELRPQRRSLAGYHRKAFGHSRLVIFHCSGPCLRKAKVPLLSRIGPRAGLVTSRQTFVCRCQDGWLVAAGASLASSLSRLRSQVYAARPSGWLSVAMNNNGAIGPWCNGEG